MRFPLAGATSTVRNPAAEAFYLKTLPFPGLKEPSKARSATEDSVPSAAGAGGGFTRPPALSRPSLLNGDCRARSDAHHRYSGRGPLALHGRRGVDDVCRAPAPTGPSGCVTGAGPASARAPAPTFRCRTSVPAATSGATPSGASYVPGTELVGLRGLAPLRARPPFCLTRSRKDAKQKVDAGALTWVRAGKST